MKVYGVTGWKNAGKTTLVARLVGELTARGYAVSTIKHTHHGVDLERPGTDTHRHREAGARQVMLASSARRALMTEHRGAAEPTLEDLLGELAPVDVVIVEGYKRSAHPKIEVWRADAGHALIAPENPTVRAVASNDAPETDRPVIPLDDVPAIADFILADLGLARVPA